MTYAPYRRGTILVPSGPSHDPERRHLFVICTDECEKGCYLLVPISTWTNDLCDETCILSPYEHPFLQRKSYVLYRNALIEHKDTLIKGVDENYLFPREDLNGQTFGRVRNGICVSAHTKRKVKLYFGCR
jgi:hypothetical protein